MRYLEPFHRSLLARKARPSGAKAHIPEGLIGTAKQAAGKVVEGAKSLPSGAKAQQISNYLRRESTRALPKTDL